ASPSQMSLTRTWEAITQSCVLGWSGNGLVEKRRMQIPLAAEMLHPPVPRAKTEVCWSGESSPAGSLKMETKSKGLREQQQHHKKLLAAMLSQDSFDSVHSPAPSVAEEEMEDEDDAMELLEDLDDLRMEGVTGLAPSGSKFSQGRSSYQPEPQAKVTLNICSRCARLQGDSLSDTRSEEEHRPHISEQAVPDISSPLPGVDTVAGRLQECEALSQVSASPLLSRESAKNHLKLLVNRTGSKKN
ncbi:Uncharacterized protein E3U43_013269, partial [Larimichthys crocea]